MDKNRVMYKKRVVKAEVLINKNEVDAMGDSIVVFKTLNIVVQYYAWKRLFKV